MGWANKLFSRWRSLAQQWFTHSPSEDRAKMETALEARKVAEEAVEAAKKQQTESLRIANRLAQIRRENHFEEMFRDALGS